MSVDELPHILATLARNGILLQWGKGTDGSTLRVHMWHEDHDKISQSVLLPVREPVAWSGMLYEAYTSLAASLPATRGRKLG